MNIYLISQKRNQDWDTYDSAVVVAESAAVAQAMSPVPYDKCAPFKFTGNLYSVWAPNVSDVEVEDLGPALGDKRRLICSSFNAG